MIRALTPVTDVTTWLRGNFLIIVLLLIGSVLLTRFLRWNSEVITQRIDVRALPGDALIRSEAAKHRHAVTQVVTWVLIVLVYAVTAVLVLQRFGIPITSLVAPATVAGVAVGFGAQRIVQDVLAGFFIITERQYGYGDLIRIATVGSQTGVSGTVEEVTLRVTRIRTVDGEVIIVPNGQLQQVSNLSRDWARAVVDVPLPLTVDVGAVTALLRSVGAEVHTDPRIAPLLLDEPTVMGVQGLALDQVLMRVVARTLPGKQFDVSAALEQRIATALRAAGITVPVGSSVVAPAGIRDGES